jgi:hypothetical protein
MVVLARASGLHARLVNGFAGGRENQIGGFVEVRHADAHTWVEIHYAHAGWVRYDPTPPDLRAQPELALGFGDRLRDLASTLELWWFQSVVGFDRSDQIFAMKQAWLAWQETKRAGAPRTSSGASLLARLRGDLPWIEALAFAGCALLLGVLVRGRLRATRAVALPAAYATALRLLARRGLVRTPEQTARDFVARVAAAHPGAAEKAFTKLTENYLAQRFGGRRPAPSLHDLRVLRTALRARRRG